jgi:hypothetical protein
MLAGSGTPQLGLGRLDASLDGSHLDVALSAAEAEQVAESLSALPYLALVPPPDPTSVATLVWSPGQTEPMAICADPSPVTFASARFLMIVPNQDGRDEIRFQEDGFSAILSRKTTKALIHALRQGNEIALGTANSRSIRFVLLESGSPGQGSEPTLSYFRLGRIRLYQPDVVLEARLPGGVDELSGYCKTLVSVGTQYFGQLGTDYGSLGALIVVGIRPGKRVRLWCDRVEGDLPPDVWDAFVESLRSVDDGLYPSVAQPVAFALECLLGRGPSGGFPIGPSAWEQVANQHDRPLGVPDELFEIVFPD